MITILPHRLRGVLLVLLLAGSAPARAAPPRPPVQVAAYSNHQTPQSIVITWRDPVSRTDGKPLGPFEIRILREGRPLPPAGPDLGRFEDTGLSDGRLYPYELSARDLETGELSEPVHVARYAGGHPVPAAPSRVEVGETADGPRLGWWNPATQRDGTVLDDFAGITIFRNGLPLTGLTLPRTAAGEYGSFLARTAPPGPADWQVVAFDSERPVNLSDPSPASVLPDARLAPASLEEAFASLEAPFTRAVLVRNAGGATLSFSSLSDQIWLRVEPEEGLVEASSEDFLRLTFDPAGLGAGTHQGNVTILSNDPVKPDLLVPVRMTIGDPEIAVTPDSLFLHVPPFLIRPPELHVSNRGAILLRYRLVSDAPWIGDTGSENTLAPGGTATHNIPVRIQNAGPGVHLSAIRVLSNDPARPEQAIPFRFEVEYRPPTLLVDESPIEFRAIHGLEPTGTTLAMSNNGTDNLDFTVTTSSPWLSVRPRAGTLSARSTLNLILVADPGAVTPGRYADTLVVASNDSSRLEARVPVSFLVQSTAAQVELDRESLDFGDVDLRGRPSLRVRVTNAGRGQLAIRVEEDESWLTTSSQDFTVAPNTTRDLLVTLQANGLDPGPVVSEIRLITNDERRPRITLPVTATIVGALLGARPDTVSFGAGWGDPPVARPIPFGNQGSGRLTVRWDGPRPSWLSIPSPFEVAPQSVDSMTVTVRPSGLDVGPYEAAGAFTTNDVAHPTVAAVFRLAVAPTPPRLEIAPEPIRIEAFAGGPHAGARLDFANSGYDTLRIAIREDIPWLVVDPQDATLGPGSPDARILTASPAGLVPGLHEGTLRIESNAAVAPVRTRSVQFVVHPARDPDVDTGRIVIRRAGFSCANGDTTVQFIELAAAGDGETRSASLELVVQDRGGRIVGRETGLFPGRVGEDWPRDGSWLLATADFVSRTRFDPDRALPSGLDPIGGTLTLIDSGAGGEVLHRFSYGSVGGVDAPGPGGALVRDESGGMYGTTVPKPGRRDGMRAPVPGCDCPVNSVRVGNDRLDTTDPSVPWYPPPPPPSQPSPTGSASYDLRQGRAGAGGRFATVNVRDVYHVSGGRSGEPLLFDAVLHVTGSGSGSTGPATGGSFSATFRRDSLETRSLSGGRGDADLVIPMQIGAGQTFRLLIDIRVSGELKGGSASCSTRLSFRGLPFGYRITSCQGFDQHFGILPPVEIAAAQAEIGRAFVAWSVGGGRRLIDVERRQGSEDWMTVGAAEVDAEGRATWEDTNVLPGVRYGYRLRIIDRTEGEAELDIPAIPALSLAPFPNPTRGEIRVSVGLPGSGPVELRLFDVSGRLMAGQRLDGLGPGTVTVTLDENLRLASGLYFLRLVSGGETRTARIVVAR